MKGLDLNTFKFNLTRLKHDSVNPSQGIKWRAKLAPFMNHLSHYYRMPFDFQDHYWDLRFEHFANFTFDEICRIKHSRAICMHDSVEKLFDKEPQYAIIGKIKGSMWRWGLNEGSWNEIVDAYNGIRNFSLGDFPGFEIRLDYTTGRNERGYSTFARLFLDGVFAYLLYYKGQHVLTIGFSITAGRKILIQQVQSAMRAKNRSLYKLPSNRLEFVLELFSRNFPNHELFVVDGKSLTAKIKSNYENRLSDNHKTLSEKPIRLEEKTLSRIREECQILKDKILHLESRQKDIAKFYRNTGKFRLGRESLIMNKTKHQPAVCRSL